jgi:hypothetical protein
MALDNFGHDHYSLQEQQVIRGLLDNLSAALAPRIKALSDEERTRYGSINEQNKLLVNKVADFRRTHPNLSSPEVDWTEYEADSSSRAFLEDVATILSSLQHQVVSTKIPHDYDNYHAALTDYSYTQYLAGTNKAGASEKAKELKQFFPRTAQTPTDTAA